MCAHWSQPPVDRPPAALECVPFSKSALGKIRQGMPIAEWIQRSLSELAAQSLPITNDHAAAVARLEPIHQDPFDRMLIPKLCMSLPCS